MSISLTYRDSWPRIGSVWRHHNGNEYAVEMFTNIETDRQSTYPTTIVYRNLSNGAVYSRALMDWERSMTLVRP